MKKFIISTPFMIILLGFISKAELFHTTLSQPIDRTLHGEALVGSIMNGLIQLVIDLATMEFTCQKDGLFPDQFDCTSYYQCQGSVAHQLKCPPGSAFHKELLQCRPQNDIQRCQSTKSQSSFTCNIENGVEGHPLDCTKFDICTLNRAYIVSCGVGEYFDQQLKFCVPQGKIKCQQ